jgi:hypothetical protein
MRSEAEIRKVLDATYEADPDHEDDDIERIQDTLRWVLGPDYDSDSADEFISMHISEDLGDDEED